jgi:hypothetical protein
MTKVIKTLQIVLLFSTLKKKGKNVNGIDEGSSMKNARRIDKQDNMRSIGRIHIRKQYEKCKQNR